MKPLRKTVCVFLCLVLLAALSACDSTSGYRIISTYSAEGNYVIAFRSGDRLCDYVTAALYELAADGTLRSASTGWFGENLICVKGREGAMDDLWADKPERTVVVGIDVSNMPLSYEENSTYNGFDVDLANYLCGYLGWSIQFYPIDSADAEIELNSGNVDMVMGLPETDQTDALSYSPAYLTSRYVLVTRAGTHIRRQAGLKGKTLGAAVSDLDILQQDEKFVESLGSVTYQTNTDGLFQALMLGEVDAILVSSVVAAYYMK